MAVSSSCSHLCTGNQEGLVCIWNIAEYAMNGPEDSPPPLLQSYRAHHCSVTRGSNDPKTNSICKAQVLNSTGKEVQSGFLEGEFHVVPQFHCHCDVRENTRNNIIDTMCFLRGVSQVSCQNNEPSAKSFFCSVTVINEHQLVITSSLDCTIKLWTLEGEYIGMFGQRKLWNIKEKSSWGPPDYNISSENVCDSFGQEPTRISAIQRKSNVDIEDIRTLKIIRDDEINEELKQMKTERSKHRSKTYQIKPIQRYTNGTKNTYHSLPLSELACELTDFCKPNLAAVLDDPFQLVI